MKGAMELYQFIKKTTAPGSAVFPAIVKEVYGDDTMDADVDGVTYFNCLLQAAVTDGQLGIKVKPKVGSVVILERIGDAKSNEFVVILFSEIDEQSIQIGTMQMLMDAQGLLVKKGNDTLKQVIQMIIEATQQVVVLYGNNPDYVKLGEALIKLNNILK